MHTPRFLLNVVTSLVPLKTIKSVTYLKDNDIFTSFLTIQMVVFAENF